jgi:DNA-3-methyladenine glycosylase II
MPVLKCSLDLPEGFRVADILKFHRRDSHELAERVAPDALHKGMVWNGLPACLSVHFVDARALAELAVDGATGAGNQAALVRLVEHMLGLDQAIEAFELAYRKHPQLGPLLERQAGLRVPVAATPFEALTWAIAGQQISVSAALSLRRKLIQAAGVRHSGGLLCYPDAAHVAALDEEELRAAGFSQTKALTVLAVSELVLAGDLPLDDWLLDLPVDAVRERLLAVRGIGPWTVNYTLLRGFGWLDGSLHGDVAVRRALQALTGSVEKIGEAAARDWLAGFSPWRALVGAHLWASLSGPQPSE